MKLYWTLRIADIVTTLIVVSALGYGVETNPLARYLFQHVGLIAGLVAMFFLSYLVYLLYFTKYRAAFYGFMGLSALIVASNSYIAYLVVTTLY